MTTPHDGQVVTNEEFERLALAEDARDRKWELVEGKLREKAGMSSIHNDVALYLATQLVNQLDRNLYRVRHDAGHVHRPTRGYFIPDVLVAPTTLVLPQVPLERLEVFSDPLPLVVEIRSPSTARYDNTTKVPAYQARGDAEIWRLHPRDRTLTVWRRQLDGRYIERTYQGGKVPVVSLPGVTVDLDALWT